jgi:hypothetical protein
VIVGQVPEVPNASPMIRLTLSTFSAVVDGHDPDPFQGTSPYRPVLPERRLRNSAICQINHVAFCGVLGASGSVRPPDAQERRGGSLGMNNNTLYFRPDRRLESDPSETQGKITLTKTPLAITTFINAAVEASRPLIDACKHRLEVSLP